MGTTGRSMRSFYATLGVIGIVVCLPTISFPAERVVFKTDFSPVGYHSIYYAGISRGIYGRHGLDIDILPGTGSHSSVLDIAAGKVDVALADTSTFILATLNAGVRNVKIVSNVFEVTPYTVLYLKNRGISKPQDLSGKTMATFQGSGPRRLYKAFARANGFEVGNVKEIVGSPPTFLNSLVLGHADFAPTTTNLFPVLEDATRQAGNELGEFRFVDHGLNLYGASIIANVKTMEERPDVLRRFVRATLESLQWTAQNPEQAVDSLLERNPQLKRDKALVDLKTILTICTPRARVALDPLHLGWIDEGKIRQMIEVVREAYDLRESIEPTKLYTVDYVSKP